MNVTVPLTKSEVEGIKLYLKRLESPLNPTNTDVAFEIKNIVYNHLHSEQEAVSDCIKEANQKLLLDEIRKGVQ